MTSLLAESGSTRVRPTPETPETIALRGGEDDAVIESGIPRNEDAGLIEPLRLTGPLPARNTQSNS
jgi:hypothetical protein